jgi:hypothetical protein
MNRKLFLSIPTIVLLASAVSFAQEQPPPLPPPPSDGFVTEKPMPPDDALRLQPLAGSATTAVMGTAFTYQGQLRKSGAPVTGSCNFQFRLFDAASGGAQIGATQTKSGVSVSNGLFTIPDLDFGSGAFNGEARWLAIDVQCPGDSGYTALSPRQGLTPAPYALALPGLWTQQNGTSPNLIGGYHGNQVTAGAAGATIGGGGNASNPNRVTGSYGTVGGGANNEAGLGATVGGGDSNTASSLMSTVGGGYGNTASGDLSTAGGGYGNTASGYIATVGGGYGNTASGDYATAGGGFRNTASGWNATVGGGYSNTVSGSRATVSGGYLNTASGSRATVSGGYLNTASGLTATIGGGEQNTASGSRATVSGGYSNTVSSQFATVGGGGENVASNNAATVSGGYRNTAGGSDATIGGGFLNAASGGYATIGGGDRNTASGNRATVGGGYLNTASGLTATIGGGANNTASGAYATIPGGFRAQATRYGQLAYASGMFANPGDAQSSLYVLRNTTSSATPTPLYLDGTSAQITVPAGRTLTFEILVTARNNAADSAGYRCLGVVEGGAGGATLLTPAACSVLYEDLAGWDVTMVTSGSNLVIQALGGGSGNPVRWVAVVRTAEVAW